MYSSLMWKAYELSANHLLDKLPKSLTPLLSSEESVHKHPLWLSQLPTIVSNVIYKFPTKLVYVEAIVNDPNTYPF